MALALGYDMISEKPKPRALYSSDDPIIFIADNYTQYVFFDASPDGSVAIATDRTINSTAACSSYPVLDGGDGSKTNITIQPKVAGANSHRYIPITAGLNQTTYVTHLSKSCGDGCGVVTALEASLEAPFFYECNVTVLPVDNARRPEYEVANSVRTLASSAIALQGYVSSSVNNDTDLQFQTYPSEFPYGTAVKGNSQDMGLLMAEFALGVIAVAAQNNPQILVPGDQPQAGLVLNISDWKFVHLILGLTAGLQLALFLVTTWISNRAVVIDKSYLAIARLLRPFVDRVGDAGTTATGKEISDAIGGGEQVVYSVEERAGLLRVSIGQHTPVKRFPKGLYG